MLVYAIGESTRKRRRNGATPGAGVAFWRPSLLPLAQGARDASAPRAVAVSDSRKAYSTSAPSAGQLGRGFRLPAPSPPPPVIVPRNSPNRTMGGSIVSTSPPCAT